MRKRFQRHLPAIMLAVDAAALAAFYMIMPSLRRPFEALLALIAVLAVVTALFVKQSAARSFCVVLAALAVGLFSVEMAQKFFNVMQVTRPTAEPIILGAGGPYDWNSDAPATYLAAKKRARRDGVTPAALADNFTGDYFADDGGGAPEIRREVKANSTRVFEYRKWMNIPDAQLGYTLNPDSVVRCYAKERITGEFLTDALHRINSHGVRETRGPAETDAPAVLFLGCSYTFGQYMQDAETLPHYYSEATGFREKAVNLGVSGWGPAHSLLDLEANRRLPLEIAPDQEVKAVVFSLIDDHAHRVASARLRPGPIYTLENGKPVYTRTVYSGTDDSFSGRLAAMMEKSRVYPTLRDRLLYKVEAGDVHYNKRLMVAILKEIDRISRERHGVGLSVVYWDDDAETVQLLKEAGLEPLMVAQIFDEGGEWRHMAIKYQVFDGHPSAYANRKIAEALHRKFSGDAPHENGAATERED